MPQTSSLGAQNSSTGRTTPPPSTARAGIPEHVCLSFILPRSCLSLTETHRIPLGNLREYPGTGGDCAARDGGGPGEALYPQGQEDRHHRRDGEGVVGRGGLPPALPVQEPERLPVPYPPPALVDPVPAMFVSYGSIAHCSMYRYL